MGCKLHPVSWHAVEAAQVAALSEGDAEVAMPPTAHVIRLASAHETDMVAAHNRSTLVRFLVMCDSGQVSVNLGYRELLIMHIAQYAWRGLTTISVRFDSLCMCVTIAGRDCVCGCVLNAMLKRTTPRRSLF